MSENEQMNGVHVDLKNVADGGNTEVVSPATAQVETTAPIEATTAPEAAPDRDVFVSNFIARTMAFAQHAGIDVVQASDPGHPQHDIYHQLIGAALAMAESAT
jgi:hypothetical protein